MSTEVKSTSRSETQVGFMESHDLLVWVPLWVPSTAKQNINKRGSEATNNRFNIDFVDVYVPTTTRVGALATCY